MKNILLFSTVLIFQINLYGQAIPNGTFENWNSNPYSNPTGWDSGNKESTTQMGISCVTKVNGYSGFGVRMQTSIVNTDTAFAYIAMGDPKGEGGVPYSQKPSAITGFYRYNLPGNDTALFLVTFKKNGNIVSSDLFKIRGTGSQSTFTAFTFPLALSIIPDTVIIAATSSNLQENVGIQNGSFLELDNLIFTGTGITQQIPNNTFENWTTISNDTPSEWVTWGSGATKSNSSYAGNYAIRLETTSDHGANSSGMTTGYMTDNNGPAGGRPYTNTNDTLCGYYKYAPMGDDSAGIYAGLYNNGTPVGGNNMWLSAAANYTYFEMPFQAGIIPDTIRIDIESSKWPATSNNIGSVLYIDNLYLKSNPLGIFESKIANMKSLSYPNPVNNNLCILFEKNITSNITLSLYDATGRKTEILEFIKKSNSLSIDVTNLSPGMYFYEIKTTEGIIVNKFVKR